MYCTSLDKRQNPLTTATDCRMFFDRVYLISVKEGGFLSDQLRKVAVAMREKDISFGICHLSCHPAVFSPLPLVWHLTRRRAKYVLLLSIWSLSKKRSFQLQILIGQRARFYTQTITYLKGPLGCSLYLFARSTDLSTRTSQTECIIMKV